jgi:hypothetical protein
MDIILVVVEVVEEEVRAVMLELQVLLYFGFLLLYKFIIFILDLLTFQTPVFLV